MEKEKCIFCDEFHDRENGVFIDGDSDYFCCQDCVDNGKVWFCDDCEEYHNESENSFEIFNDNGNMVKRVCEKAIEYNSYDCCNKCGKYVDYYLNSVNNDSYYCNECLDEYCSHCDMCDEYFDNDLTDDWITYNNGDGYCCNRCGCDELWYCSDCGGYFTSNYFTLDESDEICDYCYENHESDYLTKRLDYHGFSNWEKHYATNEDKEKALNFLGVELEVDTNDYYDNGGINEIVENINKNINSVCERDGSLSSKGIEIITHPSTLKYYYENYDNFDKTFNYLTEKGYKSHDLTQCGLHIHYTRPDEDTIDKILVVMEHYKEELIAFSRRKIENLNHYACFLSDYKDNKEKNKEFFKSLYYIKKDNSKKCDRYLALNLTNRETIEFRLFRGTLNTNTFFASLELVKNIVELCKNNDDITQITWEKLTKGRYITKYVKERNIVTTKKVYDNSLIMELYEKKENRKKERLQNFVINLMVDYFNATKKQNNISKNNFNELYDIIDEKRRNFDKYYRLYEDIQSILCDINRLDYNQFKTKITSKIDYNCYDNVTRAKYFKFIENLEKGEN